MESQVTLTMQDQQTLSVLQSLDAGRCTVAQAAELLGRCGRQVRRKLAGFRALGAASIPHGNRGCTPANVADPALRERVEDLLRETYSDYNTHHLCDALADDHGLHLSVSALRRLRLAAGLPSPRKRRSPRAHRLRERLPQSGMMLQIDGTPFAWLGPDRPPFALLVAVDDATGEVFARFREQEDTVGYMLLVREVIRHRGLPQSLYSDRHTIFRAPSADTLTVDDQLAGHHPESQFARAARQLGIRIITAHTPQAKGRVERAHNTLQDRLTKEMHTAGITTLDEANAFLLGFLQRYNAKFAKDPQDPTPAYRLAPPTAHLDATLALHFQRTVANDNAITFGNRRLLVAKSGAQSYAKKRITVHIALDGEFSFWYRDECIGKGPTAGGELRTDPSILARLIPDDDAAIQHTPTEAAKQKKKPKPADAPNHSVTPKPDHPWREFRYGKADSPLLQSPHRPGG
jgi:hypothetical protein